MAITIPIITEFDGKGISKAKAEFKQLETAGQKAQFAIKKAAVPAAAALVAVGVALFDAAKGAMEDQAAQELLASTIEKATGATQAQIAANEDWISTQGKLLGITDTDLRPALSKLVKATGDITKAQELATAAMDIAASTGKPLATVTDAVAKAYGGNLAALAKLSPEVRDMVKNGADFEDVMARIAETTGGAATTAANTAQGKFKRLSVSLDETKETIGAALLPVVEKVLPFLQKMADWASENPTTFMIIAGALAAIAASIVLINIAMALNPIGLIVIGIGLLIAGLAIAYTKFEGFRNVVDTVFGAIKFYIMEIIVPAIKIWIEVFKKVFEYIKFGVQKIVIPYVETMVTVFKTVFNKIAEIWNNTIGKLSFTVPSWVPGIGGKGFDVPDIPILGNGGIVNSATLAIIGERGPEAVIPLSKMGGMGGGINITVQTGVGDPVAIGKAVSDVLNAYNRRTGNAAA